MRPARTRMAPAGTPQRPSIPTARRCPIRLREMSQAKPPMARRRERPGFCRTARLLRFRLRSKRLRVPRRPCRHRLGALIQGPFPEVRWIPRRAALRKPPGFGHRRTDPQRNPPGFRMVAKRSPIPQQMKRRRVPARVKQGIRNPPDFRRTTNPPRSPAQMKRRHLRLQKPVPAPLMRRARPSFRRQWPQARKKLPPFRRHLRELRVRTDRTRTKLR